MSARQRYRTAAAFRAALEQRLRAEAQASAVPLSRLRKEAAFNRLLARLRHAAPDTWALKGELALIARVGVQLRGTKDADANWRATSQELEETLSAVTDLDLDDWFTCEIGDGRPLVGEGDEGALRYPVTIKLDGRIFEQLSLDVKCRRTTGSTASRAGKGPAQPLRVRQRAARGDPHGDPAQQLAEKLHAYTRLYEDESSSRAKDLFDMLVIASQVQLPSGPTLTAAVQQTFQIRATDWPPALLEPPPDWAEPWKGFITDYPLQWGDLRDAFVALQRFWAPILTGVAADADASWQPDAWQWA